MNLKQARALFISQYLGQKVLQYDSGDIVFPLTTHSLDKFIDYNLRGNLLLRSVSQLTDEEHKISANINDMYTRSLFTLWGILTPFMYINEQGKPETKSEKEIIALGWAKIETK